MRIFKIVIAFVIALSITTLFSSGCTTSRSSNIYTEGQAMKAEDVEEGIVENVEPATIRKDGTIIGSAGGGILGGIAGSAAGGGKGKELFAVAGVIIGGLLGHFLEQGITDRDALKIVVKLNSGEKLVIVQEADVLFAPGERVNIFSSRMDNTKRVSKIMGGETLPSPTSSPPGTSQSEPAFGSQPGLDLEPALTPDTSQSEPTLNLESASQ